VSPFIRSKAVRRADRIVAQSVFLLLLAIYTATFSGLPDNPDAEVEFQTVSSLARTGSFALGGTPEADLILAQSYHVRPGGPGREQRRYSWHGVGQAFVALPFYSLGALLGRVFPLLEERHTESQIYGKPRSEYFEHLVVGWRNPVLTALTGALVVLAARHVGARRRHAFVAALAYGLTTFAWPQARSTLSGVQATFFLFLAFYQVLAVDDRLSRYERPRTHELVLFGVGVGMAFLTRAIIAPVVVVLVLSFAWVLFSSWKRLGKPARPWRELLLGLAPALACLAVFLFLNQRRFGDPFETGYGGELQDDYFHHPVHLGLGMLLFSPGSGLLWFAPGVLLTGIWWRRLIARRDHRLVGILSAVVLAVLLPIAAAQGWHGGHTYGPRYLLPLLPFLWMGVAPVLDLLLGRALGYLLVLPLLGLGLVTTLPGVLVDYTTHIDLALQAARLEWPLPEVESEADREATRFIQTKLDWRFAAPWAHWRILRHRVAGLGENYPVRSLFFLERDEVVSPGFERSKGYRHIAWVDLAERLGGATWPASTGIFVLFGLGILLAIRGLDPDLP